MRKQHAEHNEKACDYLLNSPDYYDWVVTTAFYSALHFVQHEIFPLSEGGKNYNNIDEYKTLTRSKDSKHNLTIKLVRRHISGAYPLYKWLHDSCMTARYKRYNTSLSSANQAKGHLTRLKTFLNKT